MLSKGKNKRLTEVGPGTPAGELLRRYWQPICLASELTEEKPKKQVKILGEELVVYLDEEGTYGCMAERCTHRGCSLYYGFIEGTELRCPYHGWKFAQDGSCTEQPFEPKGAYRDKVRQTAYPIQELSGLLFVYMGPAPAPLLPRWAPLVREDGKRKIEVQPTFRCNWVQIQENTVDSIHTYYLHGHMLKVLGKGDIRSFYSRPIEGYNFKYCKWGIEKEIIYGGENPGIEIRPPMIFPNILMITVGGKQQTVHWRVPIDDTSTRIYTYMFKPSENGEILEQPRYPEVSYTPEDSIYEENGEYILMNRHKPTEGENIVHSFFNQDRMAWETQGAIMDRSEEHLGASDRGIAMFRKLMEEQMDVVQNGGEPIGIIRDEEENQIIDFEETIRPF